MWPVVAEGKEFVKAERVRLVLKYGGLFVSSVCYSVGIYEAFIPVRDKNCLELWSRAGGS